jgi:hypothetical protein
MPNGYLDYHGDEATVLPSNENALLHFSDQFAQMERQRQAERLAQQKADQERRLRVQTYLGNRLNSKDFDTNATYQGIINSNLQAINDQANKELNSGVPEDQVMAHINDNLVQAKAHAQNVQEGDKNIAASLSDLAKKNPGLDMAAIASIAKHDMSYKKDAEGNYVLKSPQEIDPNQNYVADAYHNHYENAYTTDAQNSATSRLFDAQKLQDEGEEPTYDANHNLVTPGYKGKLSPLVTIKRDNGKVVYQNGKPVIEVAGTSNYRMPDQDTDYVDQNGNKVPVVSDDTFRQYYTGALGSGIEKQVKDQLNTLNAAGYQISPDSPYADMLRKNILYQNLKGEADKRYKFTTPQDKSAQLKHQAFSEGLANARLGIAQANLGLSKERVAIAKDKADAKDDGIEPLTDKYEQKGESVTIPLTGQTINYIDVNKIDKGDLHTITNNKSGMTGDDPNNVKPFDINGKKVYIYDDNNWYGTDADGNPKLIDKDAAFERQLKGISKSKMGIKKTVVQKVVDRVKSIGNKFKGTSNKMY